jgi:hypothetical protein
MHILPATQVRIILSILNAHKAQPCVPWGITAAGWHAYRSHWNKEVRDAAEAHPYCGRPVHFGISKQKQQLQACA